MRIAIDARELVGAATGAGRYLGGILGAWRELPAAARHELILYAHAGIARDLSPLAVTATVLPGDGGTRWEQLTLAKALRRDRPDVLFAPAYTAPLLVGVPTVLSVHDVSFAAHPEWFHRREGARRRFITKQAALKAELVLTLSAFSRTEIIRLLGIPPARVRVIPLGLGVVGDDEHHVAAAGPRSLVLYVGSIFNRRHVPALVRAMPDIIRRHPAARLSIVGEDRSWPPEDLRAIAADAGVGDRVAIESFVTDEMLRARYADAAVFVFLSEYEGFGLTPLEALAAGVPIVVLDTQVAREVYGPAARYVRRPDPAEVGDAVGELFDDGPARRAVLAAAPAVLGRYRWRHAGAATLAALESIETS